MDFSTPYGKAMLTMLGAIAELEQEIIGEQATENKIALVKQGIPATGPLCFGRKYNKKTGEWSLDGKKADAMRWAAKEYLNDRTFSDISRELKIRFGVKMSAANLPKTLATRCGSKWPINFEGEDPIKLDVPPILEDGMIEALKERYEFKKKWNRIDAKQYLLTGFIYCEECKQSLKGQTQKGKYEYNQHTDKCNAFRSIPSAMIENAVFNMIFRNIYDEHAYNEAIKESLPDENFIETLKKKIARGERELKRIDNDLNKLVQKVLNNELREETIKPTETALYDDRSKVNQELEENKEKLRAIPDLNKVKLEAEYIRRDLMLYFQSAEYLQEMSFADKRRLLHWLFDGKDYTGAQYGIHVCKNGKDKWDYFMYGGVTGLRTIKGDDIDYQLWDEDIGGEDYEEYKTYLETQDGILL